MYQILKNDIVWNNSQVQIISQNTSIYAETQSFLFRLWLLFLRFFFLHDLLQRQLFK